MYHYVSKEEILVLYSDFSLFFFRGTVCYLQTGIEKHWNRLCSLVNGNAQKIYQLLGLLVSLARILPQPIGGFVKYEAIHKWVITQLTSHDLQLHYKCRALDILVCLTGLQEDNNEQLR